MLYKLVAMWSELVAQYGSFLAGILSGVMVTVIALRPRRRRRNEEQHERDGTYHDWDEGLEDYF